MFKRFCHSFRILSLACSLAALLCLTGCQSSDPVQNPVHKRQIRDNLVREAAISYASRYALYWESRQINSHVMKHARTLDRIYDFRALHLGHNLLPPVLSESVHNVNAEDPSILRLSDRYIQIIRPASFKSVSPSWRQYLLMHYAKPEHPDHHFEPRDRHERQVWDDAVIVGWRAGRIQASQIFRNHIGTLQRDYLGMILYHKLLAQGMISPSYAAVANLGVTGDGQSMQLNDRMVKITSQSELLPHQTARWEPALR